MGSYGYCLLHNRKLSRRDVYTKCRGGKPPFDGYLYRQTGKDSSQFRCSHLLILEKGSNNNNDK